MPGDRSDVGTESGSATLSGRSLYLTGEVDYSTLQFLVGRNVLALARDILVSDSECLARDNGCYDFQKNR